MSGWTAGPVRSLAGFAGVQVLSALIGFILLPVIAASVGTTEWAAIAIGQSVGALCSFGVDMGWSLTGPPLVGRADRAGVAEQYAASLRTRGAAALVVVPVGAVAAYLLAPDGATTVAVAMAVALALAGFSPAWLAIGVRAPSMLVTYEVVPRLVAAVAAALLIHGGADVVVYPVVLVVLTALGYAALSVTVLRGRTPGDTRGRVGPRGHLGPMLTVLASGAYTTAGPVLAALVTSSPQVAVFSSGERLYRVALLGIVATTSSFQGWVVSAPPDVAASRMRRSVAFHAAVGLVGGACVTLLTPVMSRLLFGEQLRSTSAVSVWLGVAFLAIALNSSLSRHVLLPLGMVRAVTTSTVLGAVVGVPLILLLGHLDGATGVAAGLALSEVVVTLVQGRLALGAGRRGVVPDGGGAGSGVVAPGAPAGDEGPHRRP